MYYMPRVDKYDVLTAQTGWGIVVQDFHMHNGWVMANATYERTGADIDVPGNGNLENETIARVDPDWIPKSWFFLGSGETGQMATHSISNDGRVRLNAIAGGGNIPNGYKLSIRGTYHMEL